ncbi:MAG: ATP-dependent Clp protease proteolytic subunit [Candidatus Bipolaricaulia bacterium]
MKFQRPVQIPIPTVIDNTGRYDRAYDIYSRLLEDRIVFLGYVVEDTVANLIIAQMLYLEAKDPEKDIKLYINTPGGSVTSGLAIYDTMQYVQCDVTTICIGQAASMGAVLLAAGTPGKRQALPHSRIMIHQGSAYGLGGAPSDIDIQAREVLRYKQVINEILTRHTGQDLEQVQQDTDRDYFMSPQEANEYGLIDRVIEARVPVKTAS